MPKKNETQKPATALPNVPRTELKAAVSEVMTELLAGEFEIPDDCVVGKVSAKLASVEAQVKSLTARLLELQAKQEGKPGPTERVDVLAKKKK